MDEHKSYVTYYRMSCIALGDMQENQQNGIIGYQTL